MTGQRRAIKLLIIDSSQPATARLVDIFTRDSAPSGFQVHTAANTEAAESAFCALHPDLILINSDCSDINARDLCRHIRQKERDRHTGIIFLSREDTGTDDQSVQCLEAGGDDFLRSDCTNRELMARVNAVLRLKAMTDELRQANHRLRILSMTDDLTGLPNMRCFNDKFMRAIRAVRDNRNGVAIIMMDLDHFKSVNDGTNHLIGSYVLGEVGRMLRRTYLLGKNDTVARYGGDEFIACCPAANIDRVIARAEGIRTLLESATFTREGITLQLTASFGVAWVASGFTGKAEDIIKAADMMLYNSKDKNRNMVSSMILTANHNLDSQVLRYSIGDTPITGVDIKKVSGF